ncbi:hypothetical protein Gotur_018860 [Gossypium turneri]
MFHAIRARWSIAFHTFVTAWREFTFTLEDVRVLLEISCFGKYNIFSIKLLEEEKQIQDFFDLFKSDSPELFDHKYELEVFLVIWVAQNVFLRCPNDGISQLLFL